ncbi:hypothetical protein PILCRDRAFT_796720 [Piloderma croceum F 1598]|uniref:F-box domain-containing protein n=1 Tax=Piloderma croceum (strain F 1598) TaxID=765440 RepID=A0A0C3FAF9_PILCF|nr:hypothetical protein PILCRDRAFT_796720 [Piloderma croceum F 1598]
MTNEIVRNSPSFNFQSLPTELTLEALSYLIIPHLFILRLLSRYWKDFFLVNESSIYRNAAHLHRFIDSPGISLLDAKLLCSDRLMKGVDSWKMFCQRRFQVEKSWVGRSLSVMQESNIMALAIQHFRVDDKHGCIIYSTLYGGLFVADIIQGRVLWSLSTDYVPHGAKCEFDEGYLLFNRDNDYIEVWRRSCDFNNAILPAVSEPDEMQWDAFVKASERHRSDKPRGHFRPWTLLQVPSVTAATLCFLYPTFLVVYKEHAILWDIPTSQVSLTITFAQSAMIDRSHGCTNNAQLTETLIFICFDKQMTVFSRVDGAQLYSLSISQISHGFTNLEILSNEPYSQTSAAADGAVLIPRTVHVYKQSDSWGDSGYFVSDHKFASGTFSFPPPWQ